MVINTVDKDHKYLLCWDKPCGMRGVVFHTFKDKPSLEMIAEATRVKSEKEGVDISPMLFVEH